MARVAACLLAVGSLLGLVALLLPHDGRVDPAGTVVGCVAGLVVAAGIALRGHRLPMPAFHAVVVTGIVLSAWSVHFTGVADGSSFFYLWVVLYTFYFLSLRAALVHMAVLSLSYAIVLAVDRPAFPLVASWVTVCGSLTVTGVMVGVLKQRVQALIEGLASAASTDPLTGLLNRRGFHELFEIELERARRGRRPLGIVVGDLDHFKEVNDRYGHSAGDRVLQRVADHLSAAARRIDGAGRTGGEEFALIVPDTDAEGAYALAERLRREVRETFASEEVSPTISFGIASFPRHGETAEELLRAADRAMYAAKELGRDRSVVHGSDAVAVLGGAGNHGRSARLETESAMPGRSTDEQREEILALLARPDAIVPVFQPLVALATGHVAGYEALARFPAPDARPPNVWFDQAHRCGLGPDLQARAIREALASPQRPAGTFLSLNLSPSVLAAPEVHAVLPDDLSEIVIEITEQELAGDDLSLESNLAALRARGVRVAVDDAGVGYAGLHQIMRVQPDIIKLDGALIRGVDTDPAKMALAESFVRFGRRTGAAVCAEGIESVEELTVLADLDVIYGQGYALGRPAPPWAGVDTEACEACRLAFATAMLRAPLANQVSENGDRRLEQLTSKLSQATSIDDLPDVMRLVAEELNADSAWFSQWDRQEGYVETLSAEDWYPTGDRFHVDAFPATRHVLESQEALQVLVSDPSADPAEVAQLKEIEGVRSMLMVPVVARGETVGLLELFIREERPWSRLDINRARIVSFQLGAVLALFARRGAEQTA